MKMSLSDLATMKAIAIVAVLAASPALAADAQSTPPATFEPEPPCTGYCGDVSLLVQDQCVWASNDEKTPVVLVLTLANGSTAQFILKSGTSSTAANAPYDNKQCDNLENMVQTINQHGPHGAAEDLAGDTTLAQQLKTCNAQEIAARQANWKKDEYYVLGSRPVRRPSPLGIGGSYMGTETYPIYWVRLKTGSTCFPALHDIKSYTATTTQTIGSWVISGADHLATAVLTPAAITFPLSGSPGSGANMITSDLELAYGQQSQFQGEIVLTLRPTPRSPALPGGEYEGFSSTTVFHVLADGKDVGQVPAVGGVSIARVGLNAMFGANLAALASVQTLSITATNSPTGNPNIFVANLQQTAAALAAMKAFAGAM